MIVFIRGAADGEPVRGFLPLCQSLDGAWQPVSDEPLSTANEAIEACIHRLRADVRNYDDDIIARRQCIDANLARLRDRAKSRDRVVIHGQACPIDRDGSTVIPTPLAPPTRLPLSLSGIAVGDELFEVLRRAVRKPAPSRERVLALVSDMVRDSPYDLLLSVGETAPVEAAARSVADVAVLLVSVSQRRGQKSLWYRDAYHAGWDGEGRSPEGTEEFGGVVRRVIDDDGPEQEPAAAEGEQEQEQEQGDPAHDEGPDAPEPER